MPEVMIRYLHPNDVSYARAETPAGIVPGVVYQLVEEVLGWETPRPQEMLDEWFAEKRQAVVAVTVDETSREKVLGCMVVRVQKNAFIVERILVSPAEQGKGVGRRMVEWLKTKCSGEGVKLRCIAARVPVNEIRLLKFFGKDKCGFQVQKQLTDDENVFFVWVVDAQVRGSKST